MNITKKQFKAVSNHTPSKLKSVGSVISKCFSFYGNRMAYIDLNAGPGLYGGNKGAAFSVLSSLPRSRNATVILIDKDKSVFSSILSNLGSIQTQCSDIRLKCMDNLAFAKIYAEQLAKEFKGSNGLIFADPMGGGEHEMKAIQLLVKDSNFDVLLHFQSTNALRHNIDLQSYFDKLDRKYKSVTDHTVGLQGFGIFFATNDYYLNDSVEVHKGVSHLWDTLDTYNGKVPAKKLAKRTSNTGPNRVAVPKQAYGINLKLVKEFLRGRKKASKTSFTMIEFTEFIKGKYNISKKMPSNRLRVGIAHGLVERTASGVFKIK